MAHRRSLRFDLDVTDGLARRLSPDAVIVQEDRNLVMGQQGVLDLDASHALDAAYLAVAAHRPLPLGRYLLRRRSPVSPSWTYQAVVHDLELKPSSRVRDVRQSLAAILRDALRRNLDSVASQPLGRWREQGLAWAEVAEAFDAAIIEVCREMGKGLRLTMMLDSVEEQEELSTLLRSRVLSRASRSFRTVEGDAAVAEVREGEARLHVRFVPGSLSGYLVTRVDGDG